MTVGHGKIAESDGKWTAGVCQESFFSHVAYDSAYPSIQLVSGFGQAFKSASST
jgi:hypothetical protein